MLNLDDCELSSEGEWGVRKLEMELPLLRIRTGAAPDAGIREHYLKRSKK